MASKGLAYDQVDSRDKEARRDKLMGLAGVENNNFSTTNFYRVPFLQALGMVQNRQVYVEAGYAYVPVLKVKYTSHFALRTQLFI